MKKLSIQLTVCFLLSLFLFNSCLKDDDNARLPAGFMTFVNAFPEANGIYFLTDLGTLPLAYQNFSPTDLYVGNHNLAIYSSEDNRKLIDSAIVVKDSTAYSSFIFGTLAHPKFGITQDKTIEGLNEKTGFRFFNLANNVNHVNLIFSDQTQAAFVDRAPETGESVVQHQTFEAKEGGMLNMIITDAEGNEIAKREGYDFKKGRYYSIFLTGTKDDADRPLYIGVIYH